MREAEWVWAQPTLAKRTGCGHSPPAPSFDEVVVACVAVIVLAFKEVVLVALAPE